MTLERSRWMMSGSPTLLAMTHRCAFHSLCPTRPGDLETDFALEELRTQNDAVACELLRIPSRSGLLRHPFSTSIAIKSYCSTWPHKSTSIRQSPSLPRSLLPTSPLCALPAFFQCPLSAPFALLPPCPAPAPALRASRPALCLLCPRSAHYFAICVPSRTNGNIYLQMGQEYIGSLHSLIQSPPKRQFLLRLCFHDGFYVIDKFHCLTRFVVSQSHAGVDTSVFHLSCQPRVRHLVRLDNSFLFMVGRKTTQPPPPLWFPYGKDRGAGSDGENMPCDVQVTWKD